MPHSIYLEGLSHRAPIPSAAQVGPLLHSGGIVGLDRETGQLPEDLAGQCANMFVNVAAILEAAGATPQEIVKLTVWMEDRGARDVLNVEWEKMFPDPARRPARHTQETALPGPVKIQCEFLAWTGPI